VSPVPWCAPEDRGGGGRGERASGPEPTEGRAAAFFDVDGTLAHTTIVHYYIYFRRRRMSPLIGAIWQRLYLVRCLHYLLVDRLNRTRLNTIFYRSYRGMPARDIRELADDCHAEVVQPRRYTEGVSCVRAHRYAGRMIVLVTGSLDFVIAPLAAELGADAVLAASLEEHDGAFTGRLTGPPLSDQEKARRVREFARERGIDLVASYAYGDSVADLPLLECVGHPNVVNPNRRLRRIAESRRWPRHTWGNVPNPVGGVAPDCVGGPRRHTRRSEPDSPS
jgi:HAD superfamily hydrolase (TIGR01490 family)